MLAWLTLSLALSSGDVAWLGAPPEQPARIVSLAPSVTELLFALGEGARVVGVTRYDDHPEAVRKLPRVGGFTDTNLEAVLSLEPDAVITVPTSGGRRTADRLHQLGVPVLLVPAQRLDDLWVTIDTLGRLFNQPARANALTEQLRDALAQIRSANDKEQRIKVLVVVGQRPLIAAGPQTYLSELLYPLGAVNVLPSGPAYPSIDWEAIASMQPDVIVDVSMSAAATDFWRQTSSLFPRTRVEVLVDSELQRIGPRLPQALQLLARALRPESP